MTSNEQILANILKAAEANRNGTAVEEDETATAVIDTTSDEQALYEAEQQLAEHLASPRPGNDRYGRWARSWNRTAKALRDDVNYYKAKLA